MKRVKLTKVLAGASTPVIAAYNLQRGFPKTTVIAKHRCDSCKTQITLNKMQQPVCVCCASSMKMLGNETQTLNEKDFKDLQPLGECENCGTGFVTLPEMQESMAGMEFNCPVCAEAVVADDGDEEEDSGDEGVTDSDYSEDDSEDATSDSSDSSDDSDEELDNLIKQISPEGDNTDNTETATTTDSTETNTSATPVADTTTEDNSDKTSADATPPVPGVVKTDQPDPTATAEDASAGTDSTEDTSSTDNPDATSEDDSEDSSEDEDEDSAIESSLFKAMLKAAKKPEVVASANFKNWYLFSEGSPIAIASFDKAEASVQRVFRTANFAPAFESALASDGELNQQLLTDFGFEPVKVNVEMDDVTKQVIDDTVTEKTKDLNEKIANLSEMFEQALGTASIGSIKGLFGSNSLRDTLIAKLNASNVRNADTLVDNILAQEMPNFIKSIVIKAKDLMDKPAGALQEIASMVKDANFRTPASKPDNKVVPFSVMASTDNNENPENGNLGNRNTRSTAGVASSLLSGLQTRASRPGGVARGR